MELKLASAIAVAICYKLQPYCNKINIAGSIRRKKREVKDLEIVALPLTFPIHNIFNEIIDTQADPHFATLVNSLGVPVKGNPNGRYMQIDLPEGIKLDLFLPQQHDYYRQYVIRTGSADYSAKVIAGAWKKMGWCGTKDGLRLQKECYKDSNDTWHCVSKTPTLPPVWESELAFLEWINLPYVEPWLREVY